jgi:hypothetical protein
MEEAMLRRVSIGVLLAGLCLVSEAEAQTAQKFSIQASALGAKLTAVRNSDLAFGGGGELQLRYNPSAFSIGVGVQSTYHELGNNSVTFTGGFIEPRYLLAALGDVVALYGSARFMTLSATFEILGVQTKFDGTGIAGGGGLLIRLGSRVNGDLGLTVGKERYEGESSDGVTVISRLGLAIGIG